MSKITFSTGEIYEFDGEVSVSDAASALGIISREVLTAKVNGAIKELEKNGKLEELAKKYGFENTVQLVEDIEF